MRTGDRSTHLELFVQMMCQGVDCAWRLHNVNGASSEPGTLQLAKEGFLRDERANTCREAKHFVEADCHCVDGGFRE